MSTISIKRYLAQFNTKLPFTNDDLADLLEKLTSTIVETYNYSVNANMAAKTVDKSIVPLLERYLRSYKDEHPDASPTIASTEDSKAFTAYYLLVYYYREYEKMDKLADAIAMYQECFADSFALAHQIRGRYLRRIGREEEALEEDRSAKRLLAEKGISNIAVDVTYASTISLLLEKRERMIDPSEVKSSIDAVKKAISVRRDYPKYPYLLAKLEMFSQINEFDNVVAYNQCRETIARSKENLRKAIELEDEYADYYAASVAEYKSYMRQADFILAEARLLNEIEKERTALKHALDSRAEDVSKNIESRFVSQQERNFELLALFTSIVAIIVVAIGLFAKGYRIREVLFGIVVMNASVIAVYSTVLLLLGASRKRDLPVGTIDNCRPSSFSRCIIALCISLAIIVAALAFNLS